MPGNNYKLEASVFKQQLATLHLVDVRTQREWDDFNLGGLHLPLDFLLERIDLLDSGRKYVIICYNGTQSQIACRLLQSKGFEVENLEGGLEAYLSL